MLAGTKAAESLMLRQLGNSQAATQRRSSKNSESHEYSESHEFQSAAEKLKFLKKGITAGYISNIKLFSIMFITLSLFHHF